MKKLRTLLYIILSIAILVISGCSSVERVTDDMYLTNVYATHYYVGNPPVEIPPAGYALIASPTFTGTVVIPTPFTIGAVSMTATGTQLNYLNAATGTTGTTNTKIVLSTSPTITTPALDGLATSIILSTTGAAEGLVVRCTNDGATGAANTIKTLSASPAANDIVGAFYFQGDNSVGALKNYTRFNCSIGSPTSGAESGYFQFQVMRSGTVTTYLKLDGTTGLAIWTNCNQVLTAGDLKMSQIASEPSSTADRAGIYAIDLSAGNCTLGIDTETAIAVDASLVSTHSLTIRANGATYKIPLILVP
jgi:hypothetical protein